MENQSPRRRGRKPKPLETKGQMIPWRVPQSTIDAVVEIADQTQEAQGEVLQRIIAKEYKRITKG
jgi:hypothetical protein